MNLAPLQISEDEAKAHLAEYEAELRRERNAEDEAIAMAYRAAARGHAVISMARAFDIAGRFDDGYPRLAICRADATKCWLYPGSQHLVFSDDGVFRRRALVGSHEIRVPWDRGSHGWMGTVSTVVPIVPPRHRPRRPRLGRFHVLWEVESWTPEPPRDPALVRHIRGDLWAVLATWDLTDIERAVLAQRAS